ncbi:MAG: HEPN domain-containing protein [Elusimicrobiota bacterium]
MCFVAAKHSLQAAIAMRGEGYSSKVVVLLPLTEKHFGESISGAFKKLFNLYIKSEYNIELLSNEEAKISIECAKEIHNVYLA